MSCKSLSVCLGRFQPLHLGHVDLIQHSLELSEATLVVIGSAFQPATPRNPFNWEDRAEMIRQAMPADALPRLHFVPLRDFYDSDRWAKQLSQVIETSREQLDCPPDQITFLGRFKDCLVEKHVKPGCFHQIHRARFGQLSSTVLRDWLFSSCDSSFRSFLENLDNQFKPASWLPPATHQFLLEWQATPIFRELCEEWAELYQYKQAWAVAPYPAIMVTADVVIRCGSQVLLIERGRRPGKGLLALPGGFIDQNETTYQSAVRELVEETAIELSEDELKLCLHGACVFDHPDRSQRGRVITHAFYFKLAGHSLPKVTPGDDAGKAIWVELSELSALESRFHDDHFFILDRFLGLLEPISSPN